MFCYFFVLFIAFIILLFYDDKLFVFFLNKKGNFNVEFLQKKFSSKEKVIEETKKMLNEFQTNQFLIANLNEGLLLLLF
jgi:hypothetical protein